MVYDDAGADRRILYIGPMRNSETTTETLYQVFHLKQQAPEWAERLQGISNDNACGLMRHVLYASRSLSLFSALLIVVRVFGLLALHSAKLRSFENDAKKGHGAKNDVQKYYEWVRDDLKVFVDNFHYKNHSEDDQFCIDNCDPALYPELSENTDTEACEQINRGCTTLFAACNQEFTSFNPHFGDSSRALCVLFRFVYIGWVARLKLMLNHMAYNKANYQCSELAEMHNERGLLLDILSSKYMPSERLNEVRAAYGLPFKPSSVDSRLELAKLLLAGTRSWSPDLLAAHRTRVGNGVRCARPT